MLALRHARIIAKLVSLHAPCNSMYRPFLYTTVYKNMHIPTTSKLTDTISKFSTVNRFNLLKPKTYIMYHQL